MHKVFSPPLWGLKEKDLEVFYNYSVRIQYSEVNYR